MDEIALVDVAETFENSFDQAAGLKIWEFLFLDLVTVLDDAFQFASCKQLHG